MLPEAELSWREIFSVYDEKLVKRGKKPLTDGEKDFCLKWMDILSNFPSPIRKTFFYLPLTAFLLRHRFLSKS